MRRAWMLAACAVLMASTAEAITVDETAVKFGTTYKPEPQIVTITSTLPFTITTAPGGTWHPGLTVTPVGGVGPARIEFRLDERKASSNEVHFSRLRVCDALSCVEISVRISCSGSSGCLVPEGSPTARPVPIGSVVPVPTRTAVPGAPVPTRTAAPPPLPSSQPSPVTGFSAPVIPWSVVSISKRVPTQFLKWCPVAGGFVSSDQPCADAIENTRNVAGFAALRMADHFPGRDTRWMHNALDIGSGVTHLIVHLWTVYRGNFGNYTNTWRTDKDGRQYHVMEGILDELVKKILADPAFARFVAAWPESTLESGDPMRPKMEAPLLDLLDLRLSDDGTTVVPGARFIRWTVNEATYDSRALTRGVLDYEMVLQALTPEQKALVMATHHAHHRVTAWHCGGEKPPDGIVPQAHARLVASARNATEARLFGMLPFSGVFDDRWSTVDASGNAANSERCAIARAQDVAHGQWADRILAIDGKTRALWGPIERANQDHAQLHLVANFKHPDFGIRLAANCPTPISDKTCPIEYETELVARLVRDASGQPLVIGGAQ